MNSFYSFLLVLLVGSLMFFPVAMAEDTVLPVNHIPQSQWQKTGAFPDWTGRVDNTLAMNSMMSFFFRARQGTLYVRVSDQVESFRMYVNETAIDTEKMPAGLYALDISSMTRDGANTVQITNIHPETLENAVEVFVPYPVVTESTPAEEGIRPETLELISRIIQSDVDHGFPSAQLAVIRHGRLVYANAWGSVNSYEPDGTPKTDSPAVTNDTLYDLASVTKVFATNYAIQQLVEEGVLDLNIPIQDILGKEFSEDTISIPYTGVENADLETIKAWKASLTVRDLLCHEAGFPAECQYHNLYFNCATRSNDPLQQNILYAGVDGSPETREATLRSIFKTPLLYPPHTKTLYSDIDYMLLGYIVEKVTGQRLDVYMKEKFYDPMGLKHITFNPLDNGFSADECAATELNGSTRDHSISYPGIRVNTIQGQVHDEKAWYCEGGVAGHAGLFASASDLARLATVMFCGGYGDLRFFGPNTIDSFIAPKSPNAGQWGLGWYREGNDQRMWYFGTQSGSSTFGHQGWTGTMAMIDLERDLIVVYLTNKVNSRLTKDSDRFNGNWYTAGTLGFVPQILSIGMDAPSTQDISRQLHDLLEDMVTEGRKLIPEGVGETHPAVLNVKSKESLL